LADLARGASPESAAERELLLGAGPDGDLAPSGRPTKVKKARRGAAVTIRRARDRAPVVPSVPPSMPLLDELFASEGRAQLEQLIRRQGARRALLVQELAAGWRLADGTPPGTDDLAALLEAHDLTRAFERREHDLVLHTIRATGGVRARAAAALGLEPNALGDLLLRLGAEKDVERIRAERRKELLSRATLSDRVHQLSQDEERLADLGILDQVLADLRVRLPEHLRALRASGERSLAIALGQSLSLSRPAVEALAQRFALELGGAAGPRSSAARPMRGPAAASERSPRFSGSDRPRAPRPMPTEPGPATDASIPSPRPPARAFSPGRPSSAPPSARSASSGRSFSGRPPGRTAPGASPGRSFSGRPPGRAAPGASPGRSFSGRPPGRAAPGASPGRSFSGRPPGRATPGASSGRPPSRRPPSRGPSSGRRGPPSRGPKR
jgi:hypothetical protein